MIRVQSNVVGEAQILMRFTNGWTAAIAPHADGAATLAAWASHDDQPSFETMKVGGGGPVHPADEIADFLIQISSQPEVKPHDNAI